MTLAVEIYNQLLVKDKDYDYRKNIKNNSLFPPLEQLLLVGRVSPCDIQNLIFWEGKNICEFLAPALLIHKWSIHLAFTTINMYPSSLRLWIHLSPYVISEIQYISVGIQIFLFSTELWVIWIWCDMKINSSSFISDICVCICVQNYDPECAEVWQWKIQCGLYIQYKYWVKYL